MKLKLGPRIKLGRMAEKKFQFLDKKPRLSRPD